MSDIFCEFKAPVSWLPAGLISWFLPDGSPVALVTSWMALIGGDGPRIRTAWHGRQDALSRFWSGGDFVLNLPDQTALSEIYEIMSRGALCFRTNGVLRSSYVAGLSSAAPCLAGCSVQVECSNGILVEDGFEPELSGEVVKVHRDGTVLSPNDVSEFCANSPLPGSGMSQFFR